MQRFRLMNLYVAFVFVLAVAAIAGVTFFRPTEATATSSAADAPHPAAADQDQAALRKGDIPNPVEDSASNRKLPVVAQGVTRPGEVAPATVRQSKQITVVIDNFNFTPRDLSISAGDTVTWINRDDVPHTATSNDDPAAFDSKALDTDDKYSFTFARPGTYKYYCKVHPHMTGSVVVR
jgi:plastocyanin